MPDHAISPTKPKRKVAVIVTTMVIVGIAIAGVSHLLTHQWATQNRAATEQSQPEINRYSQLSDIQFDDDKINFYVFWGDGCIHCEHLFAYLDEIWSDYSQYLNLYAFEIWNNEDNDKVMDYFMEQLGQPTGQAATPTFIIGDQLFQGFSESTKQEITDTIESKYNDRANIQDFSRVLDIDLSDNS